MRLLFAIVCFLGFVAIHAQSDTIVRSIQKNNILTVEQIRNLPLKNIDDIEWRTLEKIDNFKLIDDSSWSIAYHGDYLVSLAQIKFKFSIKCMCKKRMIDGLVLHYINDEIYSISIYSNGNFLSNELIPMK